MTSSGGRIDNQPASALVDSEMATALSHSPIDLVKKIPKLLRVSPVCDQGMTEGVKSYSRHSSRRKCRSAAEASYKAQDDGAKCPDRACAEAAAGSCAPRSQRRCR